MLRRASWVISLVLWLLPLHGCGLFAPIFGPVYQDTTSNVDQAKDEGYIRFENLSSNHSVVVDMQLVGSGEGFRSRGVVAVSPGTHMVEIFRNGDLVKKEKVFVGTGSTHTVRIQ